jgi:hypothetical protein
VIRIVPEQDGVCVCVCVSDLSDRAPQGFNFVHGADRVKLDGWQTTGLSVTKKGGGGIVHFICSVVRLMNVLSNSDYVMGTVR